jgi:hypothetical protein
VREGPPIIQRTFGCRSIAIASAAAAVVVLAGCGKSRLCGKAKQAIAY